MKLVGSVVASAWLKVYSHSVPLWIRLEIPALHNTLYILALFTESYDWAQLIRVDSFSYKNDSLHLLFINVVINTL